MALVEHVCAAGYGKRRHWVTVVVPVLLEYRLMGLRPSESLFSTWAAAAEWLLPLGCSHCRAWEAEDQN